ncbi:MAG: hypothetical protein V3R62_09715 [Acidiferrobacterales bacterium]
MKFQLNVLSRKISTTLNVLRVHRVIYNQIGSALDILKFSADRWLVGDIQAQNHQSIYKTVTCKSVTYTPQIRDVPTSWADPPASGPAAAASPTHRRPAGGRYSSSQSGGHAAQ